MAEQSRVGEGFAGHSRLARGATGSAADFPQRPPHRCVLSDISVGGCYVEMPSPFPSGTTVDIVVKTHRFQFRSHGVVQVVNRGFGMGVEFGTQTSQQREQVQQLIKMVFASREADADPVLRF